MNENNLVPNHTNTLMSFVPGWFANKPIALKLFFVLVIIPTIFASIYYGIVASDVYISEAKYSVRSNSESGASGFLQSVISLGSPENSHEDTLIIQEYISSRDMLEELDKRLRLREHFSSNKLDVVSRMSHNASTEDFLKYYRKMTEIDVDSSANIITIRTHSFDPQTSQNIAREIIGLSEKLVNKLSDRIVNDSLQFARSELENAEVLVRTANDKLTNFRSESHSIDPDQETSAVLGIITSMETQLASARAELTEMSNFMRADSPQMKVLRGKVNALSSQVKEERKRLNSGENSGKDYTKLIDGYAPLLLEQELTKLRYTSALTSLEAARIEAQSKQRYLISFVSPNIPDEALKPERLYSVLVILFGLSIMYAIGGLVWAAIKDHMRI
jgi:capsular polysaccharide transport system permease protein